MLRITAILLFTVFAGYYLTLSQNLVPNPDFEAYTNCPLGPSELDNIDFWDNPQDSTTPDYFHTCSWQIGGVGVPQNILGNQAPRSGNAYAGFIGYEDAGFFGCPNQLTASGWREYMQVQLISPLVAGQLYEIKFYVSLGDAVSYAISDIGLYLSNTHTNTIGPQGALPFTPQITNTQGPITDVTNWTQIGGCYTASGGEQYIIIGNFKNDNNTNVICYASGTINPYAYYYVEDVSVKSVTNCCLMVLDTTSSPTNCSASTGTATVIPSNGSTPYTYIWSNGATSATASGLAQGTYTVTVTDGTGCTNDISLQVISAGSLSAGSSKQDATCGNCDGTATALPQNGTAPFTYLWDAAAGGATTVSVSALCAGTYMVTITDANNCTGVATAIIAGGGTGFSASASSAPASCNLVCDGTATISPSGGNPPFTYLWDANAGNQTNQTATGLCPGTYTVTVTETPGGTTNTFWTEDFGTGCNQGQLATGFSGPNGSWTITTTGTNDAQANNWYISGTAKNTGSGNCATGCGGTQNPSLHLSHLAVFPVTLVEDPGPQYEDAGACPPFLAVMCIETNKRIESPVINCSGHTNITLDFLYLENGEGAIDDASLWYFNGSSWSLLDALAKTTVCNSDYGIWTPFSIALPSSANGNPNVKIAFNWKNDDDNGANPSFAVDDISLTSSTVGTSCALVYNVTVNNPAVLSFNIITTDATCGQSDGSATVVVTGGTAPYTYSWVTGQTTSTITNVPAGLYGVTVNDLNNCSKTSLVNVNTPGPTGAPGVWRWIGVRSTDWFEACNWDKLAVPDTSSPVLIPGGTPFNPIIVADTAYCKDLTIFVNNFGETTIDVSSGGILIKRP